MGSFFTEITIIVGLATIFSLVFRIFRQPPIIAYILTGIAIGPLGFFYLGSGEEVFRSMAEIGITLLLFILGLELKLEDIKSVGKTAFVIGISQIALTFLSAFGISLLLQFSWMSALFIAIALTFSSTIIVVKLLSDKKDFTSLYGKILIGLLLVQDFFAIIVLIVLSGFSAEQGQLPHPSTFGIVFIKGVVLFSTVLYLSKAVFPRILDSIAKSEETLFLFSIAWAFGLAGIVSSSLVGFSIEIGGFLAGLALANTTENLQIAAKIRALRDFFVTIFFVTLGMQMKTDSIHTVWQSIAVLSVFVLLAKPFLIALVMGFIGYRRRTAFFTGVHAGQISEFSLVIVFLGNKIGYVPENVVSVVTGVAIVTFITSTYTIGAVDKLYKVLARYLFFFERKGSGMEEMGEGGNMEDHVVLIGVNRMGKTILEELQRSGQKVLVADFDPDIVKDLQAKNIQSIFGDIADLDIQERLQLHKSKLVISTVPDVDDNLLLLGTLKQFKKKPKTILVAQELHEAKMLYKSGADYVVLPHFSSGRHVAKLLKEEKLEDIESFRKADLALLR